MQVNQFETDAFNVHSGVKQDCVLSSTLFALYINDLAEEIKECNVGTQIDNLSMLLYSDDIVLLVPDADSLHLMLPILHRWVRKRSETKDSRQKLISQWNRIFNCGDINLEY